MRNLILFIALFFTGSLLAQTDNKGQSIELPDFVITGVQSLDVPVVSKKKAQLVPTISEEFLMPAYSPEEFSLSPGSSFIGRKIDLFDAVDSFEGGLKIGAGQHTMPLGQFHFANNWENYLLSANVWTLNVKEYVDNADFISSGATLNNSFFIDTDSDVLPGLKISLNGSYFRNNYKFFGSPITPTLERKTQNGYANLSFINLYDNTINYGLDLAGKYFTLSDNDFQELMMHAQSFVELKFQHFGFKLDGEYKQQILENSLSSVKDYNYFSGKAAIILKPSSALQVKLGAFYSQRDNENTIMPTASFSFKLGKNLFVFGEYSPNTEFVTVNDFVGQNRYYNFTNVDNILVENLMNIKVAVKYEYEKYFEIDAGFLYSTHNNFIYYEDTGLDGKFDLHTLNDVKKVGGFVNTVFHLGPMGEFYGNALVQQVTDINGDFLPYQPVISSSFVYAYNFDFGLGFKLKYNLALNIHTDKTVFNKLNDYHNLACNVNFKLSDNFEIMVDFENVLNKENFLMQNYKDKPFDIIGGIYYHW